MTIRNGQVSPDLDAKPTPPYLNPFVHHLEPQDPLERIKTYILTVFLLPFRVICICALLVLAWALACIGLYGMTLEELQSKPLTGWRKHLKKLISLVGIWSYLAGGIAIVVRGSQAPRKEAPILVVAPHSSFMDSCIVYVTNMCSVIVRKESMDNYVGKLINFTQPIYVWRDDPNSRQNTIKKIIERANSKDDWPQVIIFPEGTCTNRRALITFKSGAFYPGVPIQPICIRYPNKMDTFSWTWEGPGALKLLWLTLTKFNNVCEIEFLPVYHPSEEEKLNPKLYAKNVRDVMAKALGLPVSDYAYDDCRIMTKAKEMNIPFAADIVEIEKLRNIIGLHKANIEQDIVTSSLVNENNYFITLPEFALRLQIPATDMATRQLFRIFEKDNTGRIDFRDYLLCALFIAKQDQPMIDFLIPISMIYDKTGRFSKEDLYNILKHSKRISRDESDAIFAKLEKTNKGHVLIEEFLEFIKQNPRYSYMLTTQEQNGKVKRQ